MNKAMVLFGLLLAVPAMAGLANIELNLETNYLQSIFEVPQDFNILGRYDVNGGQEMFLCTDGISAGGWTLWDVNTDNVDMVLEITDLNETACDFSAFFGNEEKDITGAGWVDFNSMALDTNFGIKFVPKDADDLNCLVEWSLFAISYEEVS